MAIGNHVSAHAETAGSVTTSAISITSGSAIVVGTLNYTGASYADGATPLTDSAGNTYTLIGQSPIEGLAYAEFFYAKNVTGGSLTFTYTVSSGNYPRIFVLEITSADTTAPLDVSNFTGVTAPGATTFTTTGITTTQANETLVALCGDRNAADAQSFANGGCATNTGSWTIAETQDATGNGLSGSLAYATVSSTGTYCVTMSITGAQSPLMGGIVAIKAATVAAFDPSTSRFPDDYGVTDAGMLMQFVELRGF